MRKWLPEPLVAAVAERGFIAEHQDSRNAQALPDAASRDFHRDRLPACSLSQHSEVDERQRCDPETAVKAQLEARYAEKLQRIQQQQDERLRCWLRQFEIGINEQMQQRMRGLAKEVAGLAIAIAEKIVRAQAAVDRQILERALETVLFKVDAGATMTVTVHPDDAAYLEGRPELLERLRIEKIKADRRVAQGGCIVQSDRREWDATLQGQLDALSEVVRETVTCESPTNGSQQGDDADLS